MENDKALIVNAIMEKYFGPAALTGAAEMAAENGVTAYPGSIHPKEVYGGDPKDQRLMVTKSQETKELEEQRKAAREELLDGFVKALVDDIKETVAKRKAQREDPNYVEVKDPWDEFFHPDPAQVQLFKENSVLFARAAQDDASDLLEDIICGKAAVIISLKDAVEFEKHAVLLDKEIRYEFFSAASQEEAIEMMGAWGKKHSDAKEILLFTEGDFSSGHDLFWALSSMIDDKSMQYGTMEPKDSGIRVAGFFL